MWKKEKKKKGLTKNKNLTFKHLFKIIQKYKIMKHKKIKK